MRLNYFFFILLFKSIISGWDVTITKFQRPIINKGFLHYLPNYIYIYKYGTFIWVSGILTKGKRCKAWQE